MKKLLLLLCLSLMLASCAWHRMGQLNMVSTRNVDSKTDYKLISKQVEGISRTNQDDALQDAITNAVNQFKEGEFLMNATIYIKDNGRKIKVVGDVWGMPSIENKVTQKIEANISFAVGDVVAFKAGNGKIIEGTITGINPTAALVEYERYGKMNKELVAFSALTKVVKQTQQQPVVQSDSSEAPANTSAEINVGDIVKWKKNFSNEYQQGIVITAGKTYYTIKCKDAQGNEEEKSIAKYKLEKVF